MSFRALVGLACVVTLVGCEATGKTVGAGGSGGAGASGGAGGAGAGGAGAGGAGAGAGGAGEGGLGAFGGQGGGLPVGETEVFGHSSDTLYRLDPLTKQVTTVGSFDGCSGVIDIALDKDGVMFGTTFDGLYGIDKETAKCSLVSSGDFPNSLSFVPQGTVDAAAEALVGFEASTYVRIDTKTGQKQTIGALGQGYVSSGDIVSVIGGGTYLTVYGGPEGCGDCIIEVDPKTGAFVKNVGPLGHSSVYGLAFWGGAAYGFDSFGELFEIDLTNGATTVISIAGAPSNLSFFGAGSSTSAPLEVPE